MANAVALSEAREHLRELLEGGRAVVEREGVGGVLREAALAGEVGGVLEWGELGVEGDRENKCGRGQEETLHHKDEVNLSYLMVDVRLPG